MVYFAVVSHGHQYVVLYGRYSECRSSDAFHVVSVAEMWVVDDLALHCLVTFHV